MSSRIYQARECPTIKYEELIFLADVKHSSRCSTLTRKLTKSIAFLAALRGQLRRRFQRQDRPKYRQD